MKILKVAQVHNPQWSDANQEQYIYKVESVTNSVTPKIREELSTSELDDYCNH